MLTYDEVKPRLNAVFCDVFEDDDIVIFDEMTANDLDEWDSLNHITLLLAVEKEFHFKLKVADVDAIPNVGAMIQFLMERATR
jgi:acyl carrier protein